MERRTKDIKNTRLWIAAASHHKARLASVHRLEIIDEFCVIMIPEADLRAIRNTLSKVNALLLTGGQTTTIMPT